MSTVIFGLLYVCLGCLMFLCTMDAYKLKHTNKAIGCCMYIFGITGILALALGISMVLMTVGIL